MGPSVTCASRAIAQAMSMPPVTASWQPSGHRCCLRLLHAARSKERCLTAWRCLQAAALRLAFQNKALRLKAYAAVEQALLLEAALQHARAAAVVRSLRQLQAHSHEVCSTCRAQTLLCKGVSRVVLAVVASQVSVN